MNPGSAGSRSAGARAAGALLAALVAVSLPLVLTLAAANSHLSSPERLKRLATAELVDSGAVHRLVVGVLVREAGVQQDRFGELTAQMRAEEIEALARVIAPAEWIEAQLYRGVDEFFVWLEDGGAVPEWTLDTEALREHILSEGAGRAVDILMATWQPCTQSQLETIIGAVLNDEGSPPVIACLPPEPYQSSVREAMLREVEEEVTAFPSTLVLMERPPSRRTAAGFRELKSGLLWLRTLGRWGWLVPAGLLGLIMAVSVRSAREWALWWGFPLLGGGLLTALLALTAGGLVDSLAGELAAQLGAPATLQGALESVLLKWFEAALGWVLFGGLVLVGVGGVLALLGWQLPRSEG